jgi:SRSO17 transposase
MRAGLVLPYGYMSAHSHTLLLLKKKGDETPGVQRQYCNSVGKRENCIVTVHLGYAAGEFHCLLDGDLYLPPTYEHAP